MLTALSFSVAGSAVPLFLAAALMVVLGVGAGLRGRGSRSTVGFVLLTSAAAVWLVAIGFGMGARSAAAAELWARIAYVGVCAIAPALFQFTLELVELERSRRLIAASWALGALFLPVFLLTDAFIGGVRSYWWGFYPRLEPATAAFLLFFALLLGASLAVLIRALRNPSATAQQRNRLKAFLVALAVGYFGIIDYLPSFGVDIYPAGAFAMVGFVALSVRAIGKFRFSDLDPSFIATHLLESMNGGVLAVDMRGRIRVANAAAVALLGSAPNDLIGSDLHAVLRSATLPATDSPTFARSGRTKNRTMEWMRRDGLLIELSVSATLLRAADSLPVGVLYVMHDLAEKRRAEKHEYEANHDALTGLPNRTYLTNCYERFVWEARQKGRTVALLFVDLNGFKKINDTFGHLTGDALLKLIAQRLRGTLREEDVICRFGGDEFVVLASLRTDRDAVIVSEKLHNVLTRMFSLEKVTVRVSASIGVACADGDAVLDELIAQADRDMYREKPARSGPASAPAQERSADGLRL